jgi:hypothetical protein
MMRFVDGLIERQSAVILGRSYIDVLGRWERLIVYCASANTKREREMSPSCREKGQQSSNCNNTVVM